MVSFGPALTVLWSQWFMQEHKTHSSAFFHQTKFLQGTHLHARAPTVLLYSKQKIPKGKPHFKEAEQGEMKHRCCRASFHLKKEGEHHHPEKFSSTDSAFLLFFHSPGSEIIAVAI